MFRVLLVCTGSICRSPMAEHLMRDGLRQRLGTEAEEFVPLPRTPERIRRCAARLHVALQRPLDLLAR
jgi:hypothetical protein